MNKTAWIDAMAHTNAADAWVFVICLVALICGTLWAFRNK